MASLGRFREYTGGLTCEVYLDVEAIDSESQSTEGVEEE